MKKLFNRDLYLLLLGICFSSEGMNPNMGSGEDQNSANRDSTHFLNFADWDSSSSSLYSSDSLDTSSSSDFYNSSTWRWILRQDRLEHGPLTEVTASNGTEEEIPHVNTEEPSVTTENNDDNSQEHTENTNTLSNNLSYSWDDYLYLHCDPFDSSYDSDSSGLEFYDSDNPPRIFSPEFIMLIDRQLRGNTENRDTNLDDSVRLLPTQLENLTGRKISLQFPGPIIEQSDPESTSDSETMTRSASYPDFLIRKNAGLE